MQCLLVDRVNQAKSQLALSSWRVRIAAISLDNVYTPMEASWSMDRVEIASNPIVQAGIHRKSKLTYQT